MAGGGGVEEIEIRDELRGKLLNERRCLIPSAQELSFGETAAPRRTSPHADFGRTVRILLVRNTEQGSPAIRRVGNKTHITTVILQVSCDLLPLRRIVQTYLGIGLKTKIGEEAHHVATSATDFLRNDLICKLFPSRSVGIITDNNRVKVIDSGAYTTRNGLVVYPEFFLVKFFQHILADGDARCIPND